MRKTILIFYLLAFLTSFGQKHFKFSFEDGKDEIVTASDLRNQILEELQQNLQQLNQQTPIYIDELTTLVSAAVNGTTINFNYKVNLDSNNLDVAAINEFNNITKQVQIENLCNLFKQNEDKMPITEWIRLYDELGIKYKYNYFDEKGLVWDVIIIDMHDLNKFITKSIFY